MRVAILGGTGSFGRALAARLVAVGEDEVVIGSRDAARAAATAAELGGGASPARRTRTPSRGADLAVLAVKADARARHRARDRRARSASTPLLSVASAIEVRKGVGVLPDPDARSLAERVQDVVARARRRRAPLDRRREPRRGAARRGRARLRRRSGGEGARARARRAGSSAGRALDAGPLASARALEGLTAVIVNLNRRYKAHAGIRVTGVD